MPQRTVQRAAPKRRNPCVPPATASCLPRWAAGAGGASLCSVWQRCATYFGQRDAAPDGTGRSFAHLQTRRPGGVNTSATPPHPNPHARSLFMFVCFSIFIFFCSLPSISLPVGSEARGCDVLRCVLCCAALICAVPPRGRTQTAPRQSLSERFLRSRSVSPDQQRNNRNLHRSKAPLAQKI